MKKKSTINLAAAVIISIIFFAVYNLSVFAYTCQSIRSDVIRLHILANSDSEIDQKLKLRVRNAVLNESEKLFPKELTVQNAEKIINDNIPEIKTAAENEIIKNGYSYDVNVYLDYEYFSSRVYENAELPAGKYLALKIIIGNGEGKNWWCVIYPSLCLPAAEKKNAEDVFDTKQQSVILSSDEYEIRFKLLEYFEKLKEKLNI